MEPKVGIVILNWNNYKASKRCLMSLKDISYSNYKIYFVDNNSLDGSGRRLYNEFNSKDIMFLFNESNLGFAGGCNRGIQKALEDGVDYVLLLNNDCIVYDKNFLRNGVKFGELCKECGIIGGKILYWPEIKRIWSTGGKVVLKGLAGSIKYVGFNEFDHGQYDYIEDRDFISGALMLVKKEVFEKIGLLPDVYFFGKEDREFSIRAKKAGFKVMYCPKFSVYHEAGASHSYVSDVYIYNDTLSRILYQKRNLPKTLFYVWYYIYKFYVIFILRLRYRFIKKNFIQGVSVTNLRIVMLDAVRDALYIEKIGLDTLRKYEEYKANIKS